MCGWMLVGSDVALNESIYYLSQLQIFLPELGCLLGTFKVLLLVVVDLVLQLLEEGPRGGNVLAESLLLKGGGLRLFIEEGYLVAEGLANVRICARDLVL